MNSMRRALDEIGLTDKWFFIGMAAQALMVFLICIVLADAGWRLSVAMAAGYFAFFYLGGCVLWAGAKAFTFAGRVLGRWRRK